VELGELVTTLLDDDALAGAVLSKPRAKNGLRRVDVRPVDLKEGRRYHFTYRRGEQTTNENLAPAEAAHRILDLLGRDLRQGLLRAADADFQVLVAKDGRASVLRRPATAKQLDPAHDRRKAHLLPDGEPVAFLVELGVMTSEGKVRAQRFDKFRQVNRFLELVDDVVGELPTDRPARIVDFGSGKSYLTFALYHFLRERHGLELDVVGLDLKRDVVEECEALARRLGYDGLRFEVGEIAGFELDGPVDLVVSLHACDTATDDALAQAVHWEARAILAVPCCQHELLHQLDARAAALAPLLEHGVVRERFAALATDSLRAQLLELAGYRTQVVEFVELEHTAKNLLLRAVRRPGRRADPGPYLALRDSLGADPALERALAGRLSLNASAPHGGGAESGDVPDAE
jgi:SAM-dependent methyltransferase